MSRNKTTGVAWVGRWLDERLGWAVPCHLSGCGASPEFPDHSWVGDDDVLVKCRITIEAITDENGKTCEMKAGTLRKLKGLK